MHRNLAMLTLLALVVMSSASMSGIGYAEEIDYSWGTAVSVSSREIVVTEYDYDTEEAKRVVYGVDSDVELIGVQSLGDVKPGDELEIDYIIKNGRKIAKSVAVQREAEDNWDETEFSVESRNASRNSKKVESRSLFSTKWEE